jgi:hypothetical protein
MSNEVNLCFFLSRRKRQTKCQHLSTLFVCSAPLVADLGLRGGRGLVDSSHQWHTTLSQQGLFYAWEVGHNLPLSHGNVILSGDLRSGV